MSISNAPERIRGLARRVRWPAGYKLRGRQVQGSLVASQGGGGEQYAPASLPAGKPTGMNTCLQYTSSDRLRAMPYNTKQAQIASGQCHTIPCKLRSPQGKAWASAGRAQRGTMGNARLFPHNPGGLLFSAGCLHARQGPIGTLGYARTHLDIIHIFTR